MVLMPAPPSSLAREDLDGAAKVLDELQTGDVLLYQQRDLGSNLNSAVLRTAWSHVALTVRDSSGALAKLVEAHAADYAGNGASTPARADLYLLEAVPRTRHRAGGVTVFPLEPRLARCAADAAAS